MGSDSPNIRKVTIMLKEADLPFTVQYVDKHGDNESGNAFLRINPNGTVPAIYDAETDTALFESGAILYYLAHKSRQFLPDEPKSRAEAMKWLMFESANMGPVMGELYYYMLLAGDDLPESYLHRYKDKVAGFCAILDRQLEGQDYLGEEYSIADMVLYPWTHILEDMADIDLADYPHLEQWSARISQRPAVQEA